MNTNSNWSSGDDEILIDFVRNHEILYNPKHKDYRQTQMKQNLWCEVGEILNKINTDCSKRWCYVRDYYIRRKVKPGTGSSGEAAKKRSDLLSFLDSNHSSQRNSVTSIIEDPGDNTQHSSEQTRFQKQETEDIQIKKEDIAPDTCYNKENSNYEDIIEELKEDRNMKINLKRKNNARAQEDLNLLKQIEQRKPSSLNDYDETDLFFSSMAKIVKKLPWCEQAKLRMQIGSLVGNAELRCISIDADPINSPRPSTSGSDFSQSPIRYTALSASTKPESHGNDGKRNL